MDKTSIKFHGTGNNLFTIVLKNVLLCLLTLGIYFPFAKTNTRKYFWENLEVDGEKFRYTGTGAELLKGYAITILSYIGFVMIMNILTSVFGDIASLVALPALFVFAFYLYPLIFFGSRKYLLSRTVFRGVNFTIDRSIISQIRKNFIIGSLLSPFTLGFSIVIMNLWNRSTVTNAVFYGDERFQYKGQAGEYVKLVLKGTILSILTCGIYSMWFLRNLANFHASNTYFQYNNFKFRVTNKELLIFNVKSFLLSVFTLGLAMPWVVAMNAKFYFKHLEYNGVINYDSIKRNKQTQKEGLASKISDAAGDVLDLDFGV